MTDHPTPTTMPCPHGGAPLPDPTPNPCRETCRETCTECGHHLTTAEQRHLEHKERGRAAIARARAEWEAHKANHPRTTTRRTA